MLVGCQAVKEEQDSLQQILLKGTMIVGFTEYPPMGFTDNGEVTGFDIDIAKEVAKRLNIEVKFQYIDWDAKELELSSKNIDMIWNGLTITEARKEQILFSKPYFDNRIVILTRSSLLIDNIADLKGLKVGVELSSSGQSALEKNAVSSELLELVKYTSMSEAILDMQAGGIDAIVADEIFARYAVSKDPENYRIAQEVFNSENYGIGFRLGDATLRNRIDEIIDEMANDGTAATISKKWFGENLLLRGE